MPLTRDQMRRQGLTAREAIAKYKRGQILRRFPSQFLDGKIDDIEAAAAQAIAMPGASQSCSSSAGMTNE